MPEKSSFRDPSGIVFQYEDEIYRSIRPEYKENYNFLMSSGLYEKLVTDELLIPHEEVHLNETIFPDSYKIIKPVYVPFISYPYEWCFSQLKDAALLLLKIQRIALDYGMTLKDGSGFNVQFFKGKPIFIDTLSFTIYLPNAPWSPYKQFCQHFLAPLALIKYVDYRIPQISKNYIDGIPLNLTSHLLPFRSFFNLGIFTHLIIHACFDNKYALKNRKINTEKYLSVKSIYNLVHFLESTVNNIRLKKIKTEWSDYYHEGINDINYLKHKEILVEEWIQQIQPQNVWDIGSNDGRFSRILAKHSQQVISIESDFICVENNYRTIKANKEENILPLYIDITNPTPGIGWENKERKSLLLRDGKPDLIALLAVTHHFTITFNVSLKMLANWLASNCKWLIIEFIPKNDKKVQLLLLNREDIFQDYDETTFEYIFIKNFTIQKKCNISESGRLLYLMTTR